MTKNIKNIAKKIRKEVCLYNEYAIISCPHNNYIVVTDSYNRFEVSLYVGETVEESELFSFASFPINVGISHIINRDSFAVERTEELIATLGSDIKRIYDTFINIIKECE